jgi:hypothetical protein
MYVLYGIAIVGLLLCGFVQLRNVVVFKAQTKRSKQIHMKHIQLIREGKYKEVDYTEYEHGDDYDAQMWMLNKWTYEDFYGEKK